MTTHRYRHLFDDAQETAVERVAKIISAAGQSAPEPVRIKGAQAVPKYKDDDDRAARAIVQVRDAIKTVGLELIIAEMRRVPPDSHMLAQAADC